jgi:hypothetical protein
MMNPFEDVSWNPDRAERRSFAKSLIIGFPCLAAVWLVVGYLRGHGWRIDSSLLIAGIGAGAGLVLLAIPAIVRPFYVVWYAIACSIGLVVGNLLMGLVFYVFISGLGLVMRLFGRRGMSTGLNRSASTYWLDTGPAPDAKRYFRQF